MPNPFDFIRELREMNEILTDKLDQIINRLDKLIDLDREFRQGYYGDGK